jgi:hypothetical protein
MDYAKRFAINLAMAIWGSSAWYGWIWRSLLLVGFIPTSRDTVKPVLEYLGLQWIPSSWFVIFALAVLAIGLAIQCANWATPNVIFNPIIRRDRADRIEIKLPVRSAASAHDKCRATLDIYDFDGRRIGQQLSITTTRRLEANRISGEKKFGRFAIDDEAKELSLLSLFLGEGKFSKANVLTIEHEHGEENLSLDSCRLDVSVVGAGRAAKKSFVLVALPDSIYISDGINGHGVEINPKG